MKDIRLVWEPNNLTPLSVIENRFKAYMKGKEGGVTILENGTLLFITDGDNDVEDAHQAMNEARFLTDFSATELKEGGYLVTFHEAVAVFVGADEFNEVRGEIERRVDELKFPGEEFIAGDSSHGVKLLIGLYARGKLQKDAYDFHFHKRVFGQ